MTKDEPQKDGEYWIYPTQDAIVGNKGIWSGSLTSLPMFHVILVGDEVSHFWGPAGGLDPFWGY